jgi:hypothetical protein
MGKHLREAVNDGVIHHHGTGTQSPARLQLSRADPAVAGVREVRAQLRVRGSRLEQASVWISPVSAQPLIHP